MHPKAHTSTFSLYIYLLTNSGAMFNGDPKTKLIPSYQLNLQANPKSISFTLKFSRSPEVNKMFSSFKSLWTIFLECK